MRVTMRKRLAVLVSAVLLTTSGGLALPAQSVFAETSAYPIAANAQTEGGTQTKAGNERTDYIDVLVGKFVSNLRELAAALANVDYDTFIQEIQSGKTLAEASGLSESELADRLVQSIGHSLEAEVQLGALTADESEQVKKRAEASILEAVSGSGGADSFRKDPVVGRQIVNSHIAEVVQTTATLYELNSSQLRRALHEGRSLASVTGQVYGPLADAITEPLIRELDLAVQAGKMSAEEADSLKSEGAGAIGKIVDTEGYDSPTTNWMEQYGQHLLYNKLGFVISQTVALSDKEEEEIVAALAAGSTLAAASGLSDTELLRSLSDNIDISIDQAWLEGKLSANYAERLKEQAREQLTAIIHKSGYGVNVQQEARQATYEDNWETCETEENGETRCTEVTEEATDIDPSSYTDFKLNNAISELAAIANIDIDVLLGRLASGESISRATGRSYDNLIYELYSSTSKQINRYVSRGIFTEEESEQIKSNYTSGLVELMTQS
ncbi:hypothetical protein FE783_04430 [Paenibacillus mesophilus]|uniref:hypothetical protein n=1 Tax=Paenibacillus mesophilus TaxID=2582849 RepID=UPI00110D4643|nr:hypothetical protein [Paenibacillus mesophilus]TMV52195.1 hypothetical protein FE783_04430 [Paenibacillus mesophilus]